VHDLPLQERLDVPVGEVVDRFGETGVEVDPLSKRGERLGFRRMGEQAGQVARARLVVNDVADRPG
jgi:hypothetical protein